MNRKRFLRITGVAAGTLAVGGAGVTALFQHKTSHRAMALRQLTFTSLDQARKETERLQTAAQLQVNGDWDLYQNLIHCAQSIELSLTGFPEHRSDLFKNTIGGLALSRFEKQGFMAHNINEPIPSAPEISPSENIGAAFDRLNSSLDAFENFDQPFAPHFAYGTLTKAQYAKAHAMHLADHFSAIKIG